MKILIAILLLVMIGYSYNPLLPHSLQKEIKRRTETNRYSFNIGNDWADVFFRYIDGYEFKYCFTTYKLTIYF